MSQNSKAFMNLRTLTTLGLLLALLAIFTFTSIGFIAITPLVAVTLMSIPVLVGLFQLGFQAGLLLGFFFGLFSLLRALTPVQLLDPFFMNPLISVLPRVVVPCAAWGAYRGVLLIWRGAKGKAAAWSAGALAGSLTNSVCVLGMLYIVYSADLALLPEANGAVWGMLGGIFLTNGLPEAVLNVILVPIIMGALGRFAGKRS